jgi:purine-binding chemotaxis protein CheW
VAEAVVSVRIGAERLAIPTTRVREVAAVGALTPIPGAPSRIAGVVQLRGQILPVLALREPAAQDEGAAPRPDDPLLVLELGPYRAGLLVDEVVGVVEHDGGPALDVGLLFDEVRREVRACRPSP